MKNYIVGLFMTIGLLPGPAYAKAPVQVKNQIGQVTVTALVDEVQINDVVVNRGGCGRYKSDLAKMANIMQGYSDETKLPTKLTFGRNYVAYYQDSCNFLEIKVDTDQGSYTFTPRN